MAENLISEKIIEICNTQLLLCFNGLNNININSKNTYDFFHTNIKGSNEVATKIANFIIDNVKLKNP